jgi:hypothetical protein
MWYCDNVNGGSTITITIQINPGQISFLTAEPIEMLNLGIPSFQYPATSNSPSQSTFQINNPGAIVGSYCISSVCAANPGNYNIIGNGSTNILANSQIVSIAGALAQVTSPSAGYAGDVNLNGNVPLTYWAAAGIILIPAIPVPSLNAMLSLKFLNS